MQILISLVMAAIVFTALSPITLLSLLAIGHSFLASIILILISDQISASTYGTAYGLLECIEAFISIIGNLIFSAVYELTGSYKMSLLLLWVTSMFAIVPLIYFYFKYPYIPHTVEVYL